jgi:hypothetical protein
MEYLINKIGDDPNLLNFLKKTLLPGAFFLGKNLPGQGQLFPVPRAKY